MSLSLVRQRFALLIDTCAERASLALCAESTLIEERLLPERAASATLAVGLREMLAGQGAGVADLMGVGVVSGPGSFTGVRIGLAFAKGLCLAAEIPLATVSRLAVLAETAQLGSGLAILEAGRDQLYIRVVGGQDHGREWMASRQTVLSSSLGKEIALASEPLARDMEGYGAHIRVVELSAGHAMCPLLEQLAAGGTDVAAADANYVRDEAAIYKQRPAGSPRAS